MDAVWKKLNLKEQGALVVLDAPESFETAIDSLSGVKLARDTEDCVDVGFLLAFVTEQDRIEQVVADVVPKAPGDPLIWFAYPKKSSKRYSCGFSRDTGWQALGDAGFEGVRQVAIDDDWSAIRFRRAEYIKTLRRESLGAMSAEGRRRTKS